MISLSMYLAQIFTTKGPQLQLGYKSYDLWSTQKHGLALPDFLTKLGLYFFHNSLARWHVYIYIYLSFWSWVGLGSPKPHYPFMGWIASPGPIVNSRVISIKNNVEAVVSLNFKLLSRSLLLRLCICQSLKVWWDLWLEKDSLSEIYAFVNCLECDEIYDWKKIP